MIHENVSLKDDGFQIWESDETISDFDTDPTTDLLLAASELTESATLTFYPLACTVQAAVRTGIREIHPLHVSPRAANVSAPPVVEETTAQVAALEAAYHPRVANPATIEIPNSKHTGTKRSAACICDSSEETRAIYLQNEYNVPRYTDHEWDVLKLARERSRSLSKIVREKWLAADGTLQRALKNDAATLAAAEQIEESCPADRHYFGIELERLLEGTPEIAAPAAKVSASHPENKFGICYPKIESANDHFQWGENEDTFEVETVVTFQKQNAPANDAALTQSATWETYEFESYRAPLTAGTPWDDQHGYLVPKGYEMNPLSFSYLEDQVANEYDRRKKRGDVWLSPKRGARHNFKFESSRGVWADQRTKGWSPFYAFQQTARRMAAQRRKKIIAALVSRIGHDIQDPRIQARIREIGEEATLAALKELTKINVKVIV